MSHTPGPWHVLLGGNGRYYVARNEDGDADTVVCETFQLAPFDANLIAAVPDLLEVLEEAVERSIRLDEELGELDEDGLALREKALAVIAKAKGQR